MTGPQASGDTVGPVASLAPDTLALLATVSTATITTQLFKLGLRNAFMAGLAPASLVQSRLVGEAFTLRYIPAREDLDVLEVFEDYDHPQRKAIESTPPGAVLVVDCRGVSRAAAAGSILLTRLSKRGAAGFVCDGALRDMTTIAELPLPVYSRGPAPTTNLAVHHAVDMQVPIGCADVAVYPGDVIVADGDGVVCIPRHLVDQIAAPAAEQERMEAFISDRVAGGAPLRGTYPPDQATRDLYARSRDQL
jgi:regulator of RNase E activity RraA